MKYINKILCLFFHHRWIYPCGNNGDMDEMRFCWHCEKLQVRGLRQKYPNYNITGHPYCLIPCWKDMPRWWTNEILYGKQETVK